MQLPATVLADLYAHARDEYPNECVGVVWAVQDGPTTRWEATRFTNIQDQLHARNPDLYSRTARTAYTIGPRDWRTLDARLEEPGTRLAVIYHSHPDHDAYFSEEDYYFAAQDGQPSFPDTVYLVMSVRQGEVVGHRAFRWNPTQQTYEEVAD